VDVGVLSGNALVREWPDSFSTALETLYEINEVYSGHVGSN
jgi:hypothetical protein